MNSSTHIHCVCGGFGFPVGTASTKRIMLMGRALRAAGMSFHVWHLGPSAFPENILKQGEIDGISWEYLSPSIRRPTYRWLRILYYLYGCLLLPLRLAKHRQDMCVYLYYQGDLVDFWVLLICRLLHIPVAQECCEWWPGTPNESRLNRWMYHRIMFRWSTGALPISTLIETRIRQVMKKDYPLMRVPVLVDADEIQREYDHPPETPGTDKPYLFWCGMVDGYKNDALFMIHVLGELRRRYALRPRLLLAGPISDPVRKELLTVAVDAGLTLGEVIITGFISETELFRLATHSRIALLPLWDDDRSKSRFPTKLGLYSASGQPIVTSAMGEMPFFLKDGVTALFAPPGDEVAWATAIERLLKDQVLRSRLIDRIRLELLPHFEYRSIGPSLKSWYVELSRQFGRQADGDA